MCVCVFYSVDFTMYIFYYYYLTFILTRRFLSTYTNPQGVSGNHIYLIKSIISAVNEAELVVRLPDETPVANSQV